MNSETSILDTLRAIAHGYFPDGARDTFWFPILTKKDLNKEDIAILRDVIKNEISADNALISDFESFPRLLTAITWCSYAKDGQIKDGNPRFVREILKKYDLLQPKLEYYVPPEEYIREFGPTLLYRMELV